MFEGSLAINHASITLGHSVGGFRRIPLSRCYQPVHRPDAGRRELATTWSTKSRRLILKHAQKPRAHEHCDRKVALHKCVTWCT